MKSKKNFTLSLIMSFLFVIVGLFLFIKPNTTITTISYLVGGVLIILSIISIYRYFKSDYGINPFDFDLVYGVLVAIAGLYMIINPTALQEFFAIILGIWIIINAVTKFQYALVLKRLKKDDWKYTLLISFLTFIWGIVLLINPLKTVLKATQVIGVFIIIYAVLDIVDNFVLKRNQDDLNSLSMIQKKDI